jgi:PAS domain S-box-containing protein
MSGTTSDREALIESSRTDRWQVRARQLFDEHFRRLHTRIDRMFVVLMFVQWAFAVGCALWLSPFAWSGAERHVHPHVWLAIVLGGLLTAPAAFVGLCFPSRWFTRHVIALCQVGFSSLLIHVTGGRIETHFHVFGSLAFLSAYRDWTVLAPATVFVAIDHLIRGLYWPETVFGSASPSPWRWMEHAGWVLFEDLWLTICCRQGIQEAADIAQRSAELEKSHVALEVQTEALEEAFQERGAILEGALDAVVRMSDDGRIVGWNSQAAKLFGWSEDEASGRLLAETIVPPEHRDAHRQGLARYLATDAGPVLNRRVEVEAVDRSGRAFPVEVAITPIKSGGRTNFCGFIRDISDRRQAEERLRQAKDEAVAASHAKSRFLANVSHEIRTPLNAILGFTDLLRTGEQRLTRQERGEYLETVHRSGQHLLSLINDILDLSKIEAGQMRYERIRFCPHQVMVDVASVMRVRAAEKGLTIDVHWRGPVPETIVSDPARVRQLLLNLVGNAVKFTERGGIQLVARLDAAREVLHFEVVDTGVGIPPDKLEAIFAPFTQADVSVTRRFGGTGLGLSICRHIAEGLGGTIGAASNEHRGSTFTVTISSGPLADVRCLDAPPTEACRAIAAVEEAVEQSLAGMTMLVVDDGETNRKLLKLILTRAGARVETAENGAAAVELATGRSFDAVLMDIQMPVMDGYTATRELRARGVATPIIAITAHAMASEERRCRDAGCDAYLSKPICREDLIQVILRRCSAAVAADEPAPLQSTLDLEDAEIRSIVEEYAGSLNNRFAELDAAWSRREWTGVRERAHVMKGTASMTGFAELSQAAATLESAAAAEDATRISELLQAIESLITRIQCS